MSKMSEGEFWNWKDKLVEALRAGGHIEACSASGDCGDAVEAAMEDPVVAALFEDTCFSDFRWIATTLLEMGAWSHAEIYTDRVVSCQRFIWLLCCDTHENDQEEARECR